MLTANQLKITVVLRPEELLTIPAPDGTPRIVLKIKLPDRTISADIASKSLRRAQTTIRDLGNENVACLLQGNLIANDVISDAGLSVQPKVKKQAV
jgi:hypothetical protein